MTDVQARGLRVLTANEDKEALEALTELLGRLGHGVTSRAVSVSEAADEIAAEDPDVSHRAPPPRRRARAGADRGAGRERDGPVIAVLDEADPDFISEAAERGIAAFAQPADEDNVQGGLELAVRRHADAAALSERVDQLQTALERRAIIERAKGILMERHGVDDRDGLRAPARPRAPARALGGRRGALGGRGPRAAAQETRARSDCRDLARMGIPCAHDRNPHCSPAGSVVYVLLIALTGSAIVAIVGAVLVLIAGVPTGGYGLGRRWG